MRWLLVALGLFVFSGSFAKETDTTALRKTVLMLDQALLQKDSAVLKKILHRKLEYGHSNGWIETKRNVIEDLYNGKLVYQKIEQENIRIRTEENIASVRTTTNVDVLLDGKQVQLKLHILQVWIKEKKGWLLLNRQSTKIN